MLVTMMIQFYVTSVNHNVLTFTDDNNTISNEIKKLISSLLLKPPPDLALLFNQFNHGTIIRTGTTCKKIPCYMRDSACRWLIVENAKIFRSYVKYF